MQFAHNYYNIATFQNPVSFSFNENQFAVGFNTCVYFGTFSIWQSSHIFGQIKIEIIFEGAKFWAKKNPARLNAGFRCQIKTNAMNE